jgi:hypothetical protein
MILRIDILKSRMLGCIANEVLSSFSPAMQLSKSTSSKVEATCASCISLFLFCLDLFLFLFLFFLCQLSVCTLHIHRQTIGLLHDHTEPDKY